MNFGLVFILFPTSSTQPTPSSLYNNAGPVVMPNGLPWKLLKFQLIVLLVFFVLTASLVRSTSSKTITTTYSSAQFHFAAERTSLFEPTCVNFSWTATYYTAVYLNDEMVEVPGEKTICKRGDVDGFLKVMYQDGNPISYGIRIPGLFGLIARSLLALVVLMAVTILAPLSTAIRRDHNPLIDQGTEQPQASHPLFFLKQRRHHHDKLWVRESQPSRLVINLLGHMLTVIVPLAAVQALYPVVLHDSWTDWAVYWLYLFGGVILPGTLVLLSTVTWKTDWLTWLGLGWATGHAIELVAFIIAKRVGTPILFAAWIPFAYGFVALRRYKLPQRFEPLSHGRQVSVCLLLLFIMGAICFVSLNLSELSPRPPHVSDVWFHINNAHEFRDHISIQDPRLAGQPFNYHMFSYAPTAAASLFTGTPVANLLARYVGLSSVWLLALLLFNVGRSIARGVPLAGFFSALLIIVPLDVFAVFSSSWAFGTFIMFFGVYISTTTLGGYIYLAAILLPINFFFRHPDLRTALVIALVAFAGAGAKSMFGPLIFCAVAGTVGSLWIIGRQRKLKGPLILVASLVPAAAVTARLVFSQNSYSGAILWKYASFSRALPYYVNHISLGLPPDALASLWPIGFSVLFLLGALVTTWKLRHDDETSAFLVFVWLFFAASLVPTMTIQLQGASQLFFLYYGLGALATIAGFGLFPLVVTPVRHPRLFITIATTVLFLFNWAHFESSSAEHSLKDWAMASQATFILRATNWIPEAFKTDDQLGHSVDKATNSDPYRRQMILTDDLYRGLLWARTHLPTNAVFAVNVLDASVYAAYSEKRAFLETTLFSVEQHESNNMYAVLDQFQWRYDLLNDWKTGQRNVYDRLKQAGITHLFVDHVNGGTVSGLPGAKLIFENHDLEIYALP